MKDFKPHPYQELIIDHILRNPRCAVYAGMGLGKSSSTLTALEAMRRWRFKPATQGGQPVVADVIVPLDFAPQR